MIKKSILLFLCLAFLFSCGRKADPEFKDNNNKIIKFKKPTQY